MIRYYTVGTECKETARTRDLWELPLFQEANPYLPQAIADGWFDEMDEADFYTETNLRAIIEKYAPPKELACRKVTKV